jgi:trimeric autotransporter adhesin
MGAAKASTNLILAPSGTKIGMAAVVNGADYAEGPVAPGEFVSIFGYGVGPASGAATTATSGTVATQLAGTRVLFDGIPSPLLYTGSDQVNAVVPHSVAGRTTTRLQIEYLGLTSNDLSVPVAASSPGIFTLNGSGTGQAAILNQDNSVNSAANPAQPGSILVIYATGAGQMNPAVPDGAIPVADPLPKPIAPVTLTIGNFEAEVLYAGAAPGLVAGALQVNARIPAQAVAGPQVPVQLTIGNFSSQAGLTVAIQ